MRDFQDTPSFRFQDAPKTFQPAFDETYRTRANECMPMSSSFFGWTVKNASDDSPGQPPTLAGDASPDADQFFGPDFNSDVTSGSLLNANADSVVVTSTVTSFSNDLTVASSSFSDQYFDVDPTAGGIYSSFGKTFCEPFFNPGNNNGQNKNDQITLDGGDHSESQMEIFPSFPSFHQTWITNPNPQNIYQYQEVTRESPPMKQILSSQGQQQHLETIPSPDETVPVISSSQLTNTTVSASTSAALDKIIDECFAESFNAEASDGSPDLGNFATDFDTWFLGPWDVKSSPGDAVESIQCRWKDCNYSSVCQETLVNHIQKNHVDQRNNNRSGPPATDSFVCHWDGCPRQGRPFNARYKLLIHMRVHSGEKPNKCTVSVILVMVTFSSVSSVF